jgi:ribose transport system substrate-binding protein
MSDKTFTIGYSSLMKDQPFAQLVTQSVERAAQAKGINLIVRYNELDNDTALKNVEDFIAAPVDLAIIFHIDQRFNTKLFEVLFKKAIPVIAQDIPIPLARYFGADNAQAGILAGDEAGKWVQAHWQGQVDKVLVMTDSRLLEEQRLRLDKGVEQLRTYTSIDPGHVLPVDTEINEELARERARRTLENWEQHHHIVVFGINDEMALCALQAARDLGREEDVIVVGHGATRLKEGFESPTSRFLGSVAYFPDRYGEPMLDLALRILNGERVPPKTYMQHVCITRENQSLLSEPVAK